MPLVNNVPKRFEENLKFSRHVDIAVAWATSGVGLNRLEDALSQRCISLRSIVGTQGNATDPDALEKLKDLGKLRLAPDDPLFHPKVYIFRGDRKSVAWIGSANFTSGGFLRNDEAVFETTELETVRRWFKKQWRTCGRLSPNAIEDYRKRRARKPPPQSLTEIVGRPEFGGDDDRLGYIMQAHDWPGYVKAVCRCQDWWRNYQDWSNYSGRPWSVIGKTCSWTHTIKTGESIARMRSWSGLSKDDARILLGLRDDDGLVSGLLGSMFGAGKAKNVFLEPIARNIEIRRRIKNAVNKVIHASSDEFPNVAEQAVKNIKKEDGCSIGVATRLLALARPDKVIFVNSKSRRQLRRMFPDVGGLDTPNSYGRLLRNLYQQPWYDVDRPTDEFEQKLWSMRAALLDCFVYSA